MKIDDPDSLLMKLLNDPESKKRAEISNQIKRSPNVHDLDRYREEKELDEFFAQGGSLSIKIESDDPSDPTANS